MVGQIMLVWVAIMSACYSCSDSTVSGPCRGCAGVFLLPLQETVEPHNSSQDMFVRPLCTEHLKRFSGVIEIIRSVIFLMLLEILFMVLSLTTVLLFHLTSKTLRTQMMSLSGVPLSWMLEDVVALTAGFVKPPPSIGCPFYYWIGISSFPAVLTILGPRSREPHTVDPAYPTRAALGTGRGLASSGHSELKQRFSCSEIRAPPSPIRFPGQDHVEAPCSRTVKKALIPVAGAKHKGREQYRLCDIES